ncbi:pyruvate:ferredoxin (flavodoxin) oxidoreductase [Rubellicoccus peritrichatus]|uniref:Pyruvate:ferredoxin (Flavodoxin) oxidoreductase n=1 Tax=Rubellicoccus peritrichatus TaxID=3080537 RepID=A0AAQ3QSV5_9BACT|nr:pyruvate:ferredoxin (flavodoxin) oxidoreductase [Puniceicoccus sp. CR14]WOO42998.1 pyruvate:ferredoxin (flavodoxin) oxidoreductase [Puniceicoccus sp. CR14]
MKSIPFAITDANEAVASVAYRLSENIAIYPITPSTPMAELSDEWAAANKPNLWGDVPTVVQMQSEGGVAGAIHGSLTGGTLATTFTASQGLLLMIPNMYKIAGELTPFCLHVTARSLATHALSIFGDHSDVMACRGTGFAMLCSNNNQEAQDLAAIAHAATLTSRVPFLHFFDGFRTSHEINTYEPLSDDTLSKLIDHQAINNHYTRGMTPDAPTIRGTAQNPDVFFQARESANHFYEAVPAITEATMANFAKITGRKYHLFDYYGAPDAKRVIIVMGSAVDTCRQASEALNTAGAKTGILAVRLFRPFSSTHFISALPKTVERIAVLDRTKEPGALGEPLYLDICAAFRQCQQNGQWKGRHDPIVIGGRFGLGSKEFTPAMAKAVFDNLVESEPKASFTVGINDDVTKYSLPIDEDFDAPLSDTYAAVFFGLGSDGTVGANKNTIKIIGEETENCAQAYFVYDSKKSGAMTVSHLRFGPRPIHAPYLIQSAMFVGIHQWQFVAKYDILKYAASGATILLNTPYPQDQVWDHLPHEVQYALITKSLKLYAIDAYKVAHDTGMGRRTNTIMQTCFFAISGILPRDEAISKIKNAIQKTYAQKGPSIIDKNYAAVDATLEHLHAIEIPEVADAVHHMDNNLPSTAPDFVQRVTATMLRGEGDQLPVSAFPVDGTWPTGTSHWEKRNIATEIPVWDPDLCIQCGKCALICPHATIRTTFYPKEELEDAPNDFLSAQYKNDKLTDNLFTLQVAPEDCTGCSLCVTVCPVKDKANPRRKAINMEAHEPILEREKTNWTFFESLPVPDSTTFGLTVKETQLRKPLFEFSGACAGCGETPYIKLLTQLFGDRLIIGNATGCSSIYGGNLPTTPYTTNHEGRGPAWSNSLFEDNAEFTLGLRLAADKKTEIARSLLKKLTPQIDKTLAREILMSREVSELDILAQRERVEALKRSLQSLDSKEAKRLGVLADFLVRKSVWAIGGDGWAYDIGFGGLDHVMATGRNVNILVLDTEVYSNTGGQASKSTPLGAVAKFAAGGKATPKKDLGLIAMGYGNVYVASIAMGANERQVIQALTEAESYDGPSLVIAYSHCIAHGYNLNYGPAQQKLAVDCGHWPLYRHDPRRTEDNQSALKLDSKAPKKHIREYAKNEVRYRMLQRSQPERATALLNRAQERTNDQRKLYENLADIESESPTTNKS